MTINALDQLNTISDYLQDVISLYKKAQDELTKKELDPLYVVKQVPVHALDETNPHNLTKEQLSLDKVQNYPVASLADAKAGIANDKYTTPSRTQVQINETFKSVDVLSLKPTILTLPGDGTLTIPTKDGNVFLVTVSSNITVSFDTLPTERVSEIHLVINNTNGSTVTLNAEGNNAPITSTGTTLVRALAGVTGDTFIL